MRPPKLTLTFSTPEGPQFDLPKIHQFLEDLGGKSRSRAPEKQTPNGVQCRYVVSRYGNNTIVGHGPVCNHRFSLVTFRFESEAVELQVLSQFLSRGVPRE